MQEDNICRQPWNKSLALMCATFSNSFSSIISYYFLMGSACDVKESKFGGLSNICCLEREEIQQH